MRMMSSITELRHACDRMDLNTIKTMIDQSPHLINEVLYSHDSSTLLIKACTEGWDEIVKELIFNHSNTININQRQHESGHTALHPAMYYGRIGCVRALLSHPQIDVNVQCKGGYSALYQATILGKVDCLRELLSHPQINVNIQNIFRYTPLYQAVLGGKVDCVRELLSHPQINVNLTYGWFSRTVLWSCGNKDCYELLLPHYPLMKEHEKRMAWIWSMYHKKKGGVKEIKKIMQQFSKDMLYEMRDDISLLVWLAATIRDKDMLQFLLSSYGDVININIQDKAGDTPLHRVILPGKVDYMIDCLRALLSHPKIDLNVQNKSGNTAFFQAVCEANADCVREFLIHPQINVDVRSEVRK